MNGRVASMPIAPENRMLLCVHWRSPAELRSAGDRQWTQSNIRFSGAMGIDATRPFIHKDAFERARYNIEVVDLAKFYSPEQIRQAKEGQRDYAKFLAERGI